MNSKKLLLALAAICLSAGNILAQETFPKNGAWDVRPERYAFKNATIIINPDSTLEGGSLFIEKGVIQQIGKDLKLPEGTVEYDLKGKYIYPSFVDLDSDYGMPKANEETPRRMRRSAEPQLESNKKGAFGWNQAVHPEIKSSEIFTLDPEKAEALRKNGFGIVLTSQHDGIVRGTGSLVSLHTNENANKALILPDAAAAFSLSKGTSTQDYPTSPMGSAALLRQTYYDGGWYERAGKLEEQNLSLQAFNVIKKLPSIFEASNKWGILLADKIGDEFEVKYIVRTKGEEYQRIEEIKAADVPLIVPLNFPEPFDVADPWDADAVTVAELKHWELAPTNPAAVAKAVIPFAITSAGLKNPYDFWTNLRKAVKHGLAPSKAIEALTIAPARLVGADSLIGSLEKGKLANFFISSGDALKDGTTIYENWIQGKPYIINNPNNADLRGEYDVQIADSTLGKLTVSGPAGSPKYQLTVKDSVKIEPKVSVENTLVSIVYQADKKNPSKTRLTGWVDGKNLVGDGELPNGRVVSWKATFTGEVADTAKKDTSQIDLAKLGKVTFPFVGLGSDSLPPPETILITNATVWTNEKSGVLQNTDVLLKDGKIARISKKIKSPKGGRVIDGTGKFLTNGIIDEHSHIALFSINEGAESSSAEVRMSDVIDPEDINIYRQLAGGVTTSQLLHGSANSIGGQSAVIKLKWGADPAKMWLPEAKFIKFALGENVKQSNWGDTQRVRFPQTRMGVEQVYYDHFTRAKEYAEKWKQYKSGKNKDSLGEPRRDIELDALAEILADERHITCHSYVQSEINMLMHVADSLNFRVNTFTHILEGYKLADKMAERKIGGSTFSDWWAYKMEVKEAIPYNAALMNNEGVVVAINSDDAEMARRLNQEAAKTMEYGDLTEEQAWKMVTLNPAKLLHLDNRLGSIKTGKDADVVLWTANPLSIYARPEYTIIEGAVYFDRQENDKRNEAVRKEKARLIQKSLDAKKAGSPTQKPELKTPRLWHCEDMDGAQAYDAP